MTESTLTLQGFADWPRRTCRLKKIIIDDVIRSVESDTEESCRLEA
jgi:hypothetical protein